MAYSWLEPDYMFMNIAAIALLGVMSVVAAEAPATPQQSATVPVQPFPKPVEAPPPAPRGHVCFSAAETREKIAQHRLAEPFRALRAGRLQGEALRAKLCRFKQDDFVYEVYVLRRDGRIISLYMNARNGQAIAAPNDNDRN